MGYCYNEAIKIKKLRSSLVSKNVVALSYGKDSTAMLFRMLELNEEAKNNNLEIPYKIDECVFADTLYEYPFLYKYIKKINNILNNKYNIKTTILTPKKNLWEKWFYGVWGKSKSKKDIIDKQGTPRGHPKVVDPCYYTRESKVKALEKYFAKCSRITYIGIAFDEQKRITSDEFVRYPLNEWKWSELDCARYLKKIDLWNELYDDFDRLGCFFCQKQSLWSWYMLWKKYPKQWEKSKFWDKESIRITQDKHGILINLTLEELQKKFEKGFIPIRRKNFVGKLLTKSLFSYLDDYDEDNSLRGTCDAVSNSFRIREEKLKEYKKRLKNIKKD